nr:charged multivesicular body protein 7 isoform X1 [Ipomoea batatas]
MNTNGNNKDDGKGIAGGGGDEACWKVKEFLKKEVPEWDDEANVRARFKAFSGQRCDWEPLYLFWRDLILKVARHLRVFIIRPSQLKMIWFSRADGLSPLCLDRVLLQMYNSGELLWNARLMDPTSGQISRTFYRLADMMRFSRPSAQETLVEDYYIVSTLLEEKAHEVIQVLCEKHWTSSCIITMRNFQEICGGMKEAYAILGHLSGAGKAKYLAITNKRDQVESTLLSQLASVDQIGTTGLDYNLLHLNWTADKLDQQRELGTCSFCRFKNSALASLKSGNKRAALRHAREMKLASQSREKCTLLLNRVEEVLRIIADAESSKQVSEAIRVGTQAIKEYRISVEDVELSLEELDKYIESQNQVSEVLGNIIKQACAETEDEGIEDELKNLEVEIAETVQTPIAVAESQGTSNTLSNLSDALLKLHLTDNVAEKVMVQSSMECIPKEKSKDANLEAA